MNKESINNIFEKQKTYFQSGATIPVSFRIEQLKKLYKTVKKYESEINAALFADLGKSSYEGFMCETGLVLSEISYMIKNVKKFSRKKRVHTPLAQFPSSSYKIAVPYGNTLIMSPWNYPFLLTFDPLVDAIAAGNTVIIKPSAYSPATSKLVEKIISECFEPEYVTTVMGGRQAVGREVLRHTAKNLIPVILELGGKSPCIVVSSADIKLAAKRIVFGKFINCGQTCVAPDYILCEKSVKESFVAEVTRQIELQYGKEPLTNKDLGKIMIEPTVMDRVNKELSYGGGCINDVIIHLTSSEMGFGGVGASGMGTYHGKDGFDAFSHTKSIIDKKTWLDLPMRYQPYKNKFYEKLLHFFLK